MAEPRGTRNRRGSRGRRLPIYLTEAERDRILEVALDSAPRGVLAGALRNAAILAIGLYAGLRVSEICHLDVSDVDVDAGTIRVREGKGAKDRELPLHPWPRDLVVAYLATRHDPDPAIFISRNHHRISVRQVQDITRALAASAGIAKPITPHKLRHTFATHLLEAGVDVLTISELLGHESVETTQIYAHVTGRTKRSAIERL